LSEQVRRELETLFEKFSKPTLDESLESRLTDRVKVLLDAVLKDNSEEANMLLDLIETLSPKLAISIIDSALGSRLRLLLYLGEKYGELHLNVEAESCFRVYVKSHPDDPEAWRRFGFFYFHNQDFDRAIECYEKSLTVEPSQSAVLKFLGDAYYAKRSFKEAERCYQAALDAEPDSPHRYLDMSEFQRKMAGVIIPGYENDRMEKAIKYLRKVITLREAYGDHLLLSRYLAEMGNFDQAKEEYQIALRINRERMAKDSQTISEV
jgi:tetratricopeptide (TPR) repeat protein